MALGRRIACPAAGAIALAQSGTMRADAAYPANNVRTVLPQTMQVDQNAAATYRAGNAAPVLLERLEEQPG